MTKLQLLKHLKESQKVQDAWLDTLPWDIKTTFYDNKYVDELQKNIDLLSQQVFGEDYELACWFLYDWKPCTDGPAQIKHADGTEHSFKNANEFYKYFKAVVNGSKNPQA